MSRVFAQYSEQEKVSILSNDRNNLVNERWDLLKKNQELDLLLEEALDRLKEFKPRVASKLQQQKDILQFN